MKPRSLAPYVLQQVGRYYVRAKDATLEDLARDLGIRRADARRTVSALRRAGLVDALRLELTNAGFAIGLQLHGVRLPPLPQARAAGTGT